MTTLLNTCVSYSEQYIHVYNDINHERNHNTCNFRIYMLPYVTIEKNLVFPDMSNGGLGSFHPPLKLSNFDLRCLIIIHKASQDKAMAQ